MNKIKEFSTEILTTLVCLLPIVYGLIIWNELPDMMPTHWNVAGEIDGYSSKAFAVFGIPGFMAFLNLICVMATRLDPRYKNNTGRVKSFVLWITPVISIVVCGAMFLVAQGISVKMEVVAPVLVGVLIVIIGNYFPKCRQNYTIGIKIAWTLESEENWNKTHRLAGILWIFGGLLMIITSLMGYFWPFFVIMIIISVVPMIYSYTLYRKGI